MDAERPWCTPGLRFYQTLLEKNRHARLQNQARLRRLKAERSANVELFCSHDVTEFERLAKRSARLPAAAEPSGLVSQPGRRVARGRNTERDSRAELLQEQRHLPGQLSGEKAERS
jgi:hypothetical protein